MMKNNITDDDNRVIADMSMIEKPTLMGSLLGRRHDAKNKEKKPQKFSKEDRRAYILGAMGASLLLVLVYALVFAAAIGVLIFLFKINS
jgi:hypothetical protein